jgi:hypothetical protein
MIDKVITDRALLTITRKRRRRTVDLRERIEVDSRPIA